MDEQEIKQLLLNQVLHKTKLSLRWVSEDTGKLTEKIKKTTVSFNDFLKIYKKR